MSTQICSRLRSVSLEVRYASPSCGFHFSMYTKHAESHVARKKSLLNSVMSLNLLLHEAHDETSLHVHKLSACLVHDIAFHSKLLHHAALREFVHVLVVHVFVCNSA